MLTVGSLRDDYVASGSPDFPFTFHIYDDDDIIVLANGVVQTKGTHYEVRSGGSLFSSLTTLPATGFVRFLTAPANGVAIALVPVQATIQSSNYTTEGFPSERIEKDFDKSLMIHRMILERLRRALKFATKSLQVDKDIPEPVEGKILGYEGSAFVWTDKGAVGPQGEPGEDGIDGEQGPPGAGAAPTVGEVDGAPAVPVPTDIKFNQANGFVVSEPSAGVAQIDLPFGTMGATLRDTADAAAARAAINAPALAVENIFTKRQQWKQGGALTAAATLTLDDSGNYFHVTGSTGITAISDITGYGPILLYFEGAPLLTHSASLLLQNAMNFQARAGDILEFIYEGSSVWREVRRHLGTPLAAPSGGYFDTPEDYEIFIEDFIAAASGDAAGSLKAAYVWTGLGISGGSLGVVVGTGAAVGQFHLTDLAGTANPLTITQASRNPIISIRWAQFGTNAGANARRIGLGDRADGLTAEPTNGIYWRFVHGANIIAVCRSGGSESTVDTGVVSADGVFHKGKLVVNGTTSVEVWLNGVLKGTITSNIPTAALGPEGGSGASFLTSEGIKFDYIAVKQSRG